MMYPAGRATRLRPLDIGDVLDETFQVYRRGFLPLITTMAIVLVPSALVMLVLGLVAGVGAGVGQSMFDRLSREAGMALIGVGIAAFVVILLLALVSAAAQLVASGACIRVISNVILGQPISIGEAYREAFGRFWSLLLVSICVGIPIALLVITCIGIPVAIYVGIGWSLVFPLILLEGQGAFDSIGRSWELVAGHRWRLLVIFILLILIQWLLLSIPSILVGLLSAGAVLLSGGSAVVELGMQVIQMVFQTAAQVLFTPIALITTTLLYYDLMVRKEAFDLQQRLPQAEIVPPMVYPRYGQQPPQYPPQAPGYPPYPQPPQGPGYPPSPQGPPPTPGYPPSPQQPPQTPGHPPYPPPGPPRQ